MGNNSGNKTAHIGIQLRTGRRARGHLSRFEGLRFSLYNFFIRNQATYQTQSIAVNSIAFDSMDYANQYTHQI